MDTGKKTLIIGLLGIGLLLLYFFSGNGGWQGDGIPPYTIAEGVVRGEVYVDGGHGYTGENPYIQYFKLPSGDIKYARLYVPVWNYKSGNSIRVTVNGNSLAVRQEPDYSSAWGVGLYCLQINNSLHAGTNEVSISPEIPGGGPYGTTLVAVCENRSQPPVKFWINEGDYALAYTNNKNNVTSTFEGTSPGKNASLYTMIVAGTEGERDELYFDSTNIGSDVGRSAQGKYFDLFSTSVSLRSTESSLRFERGDEGYLHPCVAVLVSESESNDEYLKIHEQKSAESQQVPLPVIIVCLLAFLAIAIRFRKK